MSSLQVRLTSRKQEGKEVWEATAYVPGFKPTKITRTGEDSTAFDSRTAVATAARGRAKRLGFDGVEFEGKSVKAAAKVSTKKPARKAVKTKSNTTAPAVNAPAVQS